LKFFYILHCSIFEPHFYREALLLPRKSIVKYVLELIFVSAFISAVAQTWYLSHPKRGIADKVAAAFPGMVLRDGVLHPGVPTPYSPPPYLISSILNQLLGLPPLLNQDAESMVVVDTSQADVVPSRFPVVLLKARQVSVVLKPGSVMNFPYEHFLVGTRDLEFTVEGINRFLRSHSGSILFSYLFSAAVYQGTLFLMCIFFLAFAAYIFRVERTRTLKEYLRLSSFAISPLAVGGALTAISGVKAGWVWEVLVFASTMVMFRAILVMNNRPRSAREI